MVADRALAMIYRDDWGATAKNLVDAEACSDIATFSRRITWRIELGSTW
jgi:hypothetical protein